MELGFRKALTPAQQAIEEDYGSNLIGWVGFAISYLWLGIRAFRGCDHEELARRILGSPLPRSVWRRWLLAGGGSIGWPVLISIWAFSTVITAVINKKDVPVLVITMAGLTVLSCIAIITFSFALFYARRDIEEGGLEFQGPGRSVFSDYVYLAAGCSVTFGTTDTTILDRPDATHRHVPQRAGVDPQHRRHRRPAVVGDQLTGAATSLQVDPRLVGPDPEPELHRHLEVGHVSLLEVPAHLRHLEPVQAPDRLGRLVDAGADGRLDALRRGPDDLGDAVDVVGHDELLRSVGSETGRLRTLALGAPPGQGRQAPVAPSMPSRSRSACPLCCAYSATILSRTPRSESSAPSRTRVPVSSRSWAATISRDRSHS